MPRPYASGVVPASADAVWATVRDFNGMPAWHPGIAGSSLDSGASGFEVGAVRRLTLAAGGTVVERLVSLDDDARSCTYQILESAFPVRRYVSTFRVVPVTDTGQAFMEWWSEFDSEGADEEKLVGVFANGVYGGGIAALQKHFNGG
jgi:hypothetical protein